MRLINKGMSPRYSSLANATLKPGASSRELDSFEKAFDGLMASARGFDIVLSYKDITILVDMFRRFAAPALAGMSPEEGSALAQLKKGIEDPDGLKSMEEAMHRRRLAIQKARGEAIKSAREKEYRIKSEENIIGPDGVPVTKAEVQQGATKDVRPELHPEMHNDLKSIIENNLAVMTSASGKPIREKSKYDVVAPPGGSRVSHDPRDYQRNPPKTPGMPEFNK